MNDKELAAALDVILDGDGDLGLWTLARLQAAAARIRELSAEVERLRGQRDRLLAAVDGEWYGAPGYGYAWMIAKSVRADDPTAPADPGPDD